MDYLKEYQKWLDSGVLTAEEHAELEAIKDDPKEIEGSTVLWSSAPPACGAPWPWACIT